MNPVPETISRVANQTNAAVNARIQEKAIERIEKIGFDLQRIDKRLKELDAEWDIERAIEANAATVALIGLTLGATVDKKWFLLPAAVASFLLQHAVQGWCPPVPVLRRLGFRTHREIENERAILLARRGDFQQIRNLSATQAFVMLN